MEKVFKNDKPHLIKPTFKDYTGKTHEVPNLDKIYKEGEIEVHAVRGIDLSFEQGEFAAIVGPSGSGKTTFLNMLGGLDSPTSGEIIINETNIGDLKPSSLTDFRMNNIGFVFQAYNLIPVLTARENVEFVMHLQGKSKKERETRAIELLEAVGLGDRINSRPGKLSGGQQQRVAIARALASKPKFILADEPTANLDSESTNNLLDIMEKLNKEENITFIFSTHDNRVVKRARRVITVDDGKIVKIIENGSDWFTMMGSKESAGTKLLSISGDCKYPGVYEIEWGTRVRDVLELAGADDDIQAVQIGGPSGTCISPKEFKRNISFEDLPTGGSLIIIGKQRNLLKDIVANFTDFFIEESCGSCVPCRALTVIMKNKLDKILAGKGVQSDLTDLENWGAKMKIANRCGLGQTAANPILTTLKNFREKYEELLIKDKEFETGFNLEAAVAESCEVVGRTPNL